jgi:hypothetical protein
MPPCSSLIALTLLAFSFAGCSKHPSAAAAAHPKIQDLGVVEVSDGITTRHELSGGRVCFVTPAIQMDESVLLTMSIEQDGKVLAKPRAQTGSGVPFQISVGDVGIGMTPVIKK